MDLTKQLAQAYAAQVQAIQTLQGQGKALAEKATQKINVASGNSPIFSTRDSDAVPIEGTPVLGERNFRCRIPHNHTS
jgi:hypothetical protein